MALVKVKPTSAGRRAVVKVVNANLHKGAPLASLVEKQTKTAGRNASLLVKVAGNWKWKSMIEGGWGGSMAGSAKPATASAPAAGTPTPANPTVSPAAKTPATSGAPAAKNPATPAAGAPAPTGASAPPPAKK